MSSLIHFSVSSALDQEDMAMVSPDRLRAHEVQRDEANLLRITANPWENA